MAEFETADGMTYWRPSGNDPLPLDGRILAWQCSLCGSLVSQYDNGQALYRHSDWHHSNA